MPTNPIRKEIREAANKVCLLLDKERKAGDHDHQGWLNRQGDIIGFLCAAWYGARSMNQAAKNLAIPVSSIKRLRNLSEEYAEDSLQGSRAAFWLLKYFKKFQGNFSMEIDKKIYHGMRRDKTGKMAHEIKKSMDPHYGVQRIDINKKEKKQITIRNLSNDQLLEALRKQVASLPELERQKILEMEQGHDGTYFPVETTTPKPDGGVGAQEERAEG